MDSKALSTEHVDVAANEAQGDGAVLAQRKEVIDFEEAQHKQTRMQSFREEWRGIGWCMRLKPSLHLELTISRSIHVLYLYHVGL